MSLFAGLQADFMVLFCKRQVLQMQDMPMFTTSNGVASLTLREIPYKKTAYIRLQDSLDPVALLNESCDFCRAVGAEHVFATGHATLEAFPFHTAIWLMQCWRDAIPDTDAALFPVQEQTLEQWRTLYNEKMRDIPNAQYMTMTSAQNMLAKGNGYFVHSGETLLGIGIASGDTIDAIVAEFPGAGKYVLSALNHALSGETVRLQVASENKKAVRFYEKMGFIRTEVIDNWYQIF